MAQDQVEAMEKLGFPKFAVAGHDRGARPVHRMALDHPDRVTKAVMIDILPSYYTFQKVDRRFATNNWYWFFLLEPSPFPETLIGNSLDTYLDDGFGRLIPKVITPEAYAEYFRCFNSPASIHADCEDYRAGATIDLAHDEADLKRKVECPAMVGRQRVPRSELRQSRDLARSLFERFGQAHAKRPLRCGGGAGRDDR